jgi:hypothetical protein
MARGLQRRGALQPSVVFNVDTPLSTPGGFRPSRRPDYMFNGGPSFDLKPWKPSASFYDTSEQFLDIQATTGQTPIPLYYRIW